MNPLHRRLADGLPERHAPGRNGFSTEPKALRQWIEALPLANASSTARLLYQALREMNQQRIDPLQRLAALEALRAPVQQIADVVDRQILGSTFPLPPQKQQLGAVAQDFQREFALGYREAVYDFCAPDGKVPFLRGRQVTIALERAVAHSGLHLTKAYLVYAAPPAGVWRTLHDLYRFALQARVDDKPIEDPLLGGAQVTVRQSYMHALLLAISNPYRLAQKEILDSYHVTRVWALQTMLGAGVGGARAYAIPLDEDRGPGYLPEERQNERGNGVLGFSTEALERELDRQLSLVNGVSGPLSFRLKGAPAISVAVDLVQRLAASWEPIAARSHARLPAGHHLDTLMGLSAIHFHLAGMTDFESFVRRTRGPGISLNDRERVASWAAGGADAGRPEHFRARVLDQSLGGYRIEWDRADAVKARVGELVGLAPASDDDDDRDWMVGLIRWIRIGADGKVDAGIELLARQARAAAVRAFDPQGLPRPPVRALQLEPLDPAAGAGTILVPSVLERGATQYELTTAADPFGDGDEAEIASLGVVAIDDVAGSYLRLHAGAAANSGVGYAAAVGG